MHRLWKAEIVLLLQEISFKKKKQPQKLNLKKFTCRAQKHKIFSRVSLSETLVEKKKNHNYQFLYNVMLWHLMVPTHSSSFGTHVDNINSQNQGPRQYSSCRGAYGSPLALLSDTTPYNNTWKKCVSSFQALVHVLFLMPCWELTVLKQTPDELKFIK